MSVCVWESVSGPARAIARQRLQPRKLREGFRKSAQSETSLFRKVCPEARAMRRVSRERMA